MLLEPTFLARPILTRPGPGYFEATRDMSRNGLQGFGCASSRHYESSYWNSYAMGFAWALQHGYNMTYAAHMVAYFRDPFMWGGWEHPWSTGENFPIFVLPSNQKPSLTSVAPMTAASGPTQVDLTYDMLVAASVESDPNGDAVSFRVESVLSGALTKDGAPVVSGVTEIGIGDTLVWTPPNGATGVVDAFSIVAVDWELASDTPVTVQVRIGPIPGVPSASDDEVALDEDAVDFAVDVLANDTGAPALQVVDVGMPLHGTASLTGGQVLYTPAPGFCGEDTFSYLMRDDSGETDMASVFVTVNSVNDPPEAVDDWYTVGGKFTVEVMSNDADADADAVLLTAFGPTSAGGGTVTRYDNGTPGDSSDDSLVYTPAVGFDGEDTFSYTISDGNGGTDTATVHMTVHRHIITLTAALPTPLTKATFTDASGDLVSVSMKGAGTIILSRLVAAAPGGVYSNGTPGDLWSIEATGTNAKSGLAFKVSSPTKAPVPSTSVRDIVVAGSLGSLSAAQLALLGNLTVTGSIASLTLGDVAAQHTLSIGTDPLIASSTIVLGRVQDASFTSGTPLKSLSVVEWLDTDGTPDVIAAPWISNLATKASKVVGGPVGDFQASVSLSGVGAPKGTLAKVAIVGSVIGGTWNITGVAGSVAVRGNWTNCSFQSDWLKSLSVVGRITEDNTDGDWDTIRALNGVFSVRELTWSGSVPPDHWFDEGPGVGVRAYVG